MSQKPYYLRPPLDVFFKITKLDTVNPWSLDLTYLLMSLLEEMRRAGMDFRLAGTAVNSSGIIYLRKAENLLKPEEPPLIATDKGDVFLPPAISLPIRFELPSTTLQDLIAALEKALIEEQLSSSRKVEPILPDPVFDFPQIDQWIVEIQKNAKELLSRMLDMTSDGEVRFSKLVEGCVRRELVRIFLLMLFLAQDGKIDLLQEDDEQDVRIKLEK